MWAPATATPDVGQSIQMKEVNLSASEKRSAGVESTAHKEGLDPFICEKLPDAMVHFAAVNRECASWRMYVTNMDRTYSIFWGPISGFEATKELDERGPTDPLDFSHTAGFAPLQ